MVVAAVLLWPQLLLKVWQHCCHLGTATAELICGSPARPPLQHQEP